MRSDVVLGSYLLTRFIALHGRVHNTRTKVGKWLPVGGGGGRRKGELRWRNKWVPTSQSVSSGLNLLQKPHTTTSTKRTCRMRWGRDTSLNAHAQWVGSWQWCGMMFLQLTCSCRSQFTKTCDQRSSAYIWSFCFFEMTRVLSEFPARCTILFEVIMSISMWFFYILTCPVNTFRKRPSMHFRV